MDAADPLVIGPLDRPAASDRRAQPTPSADTGAWREIRPEPRRGSAPGAVACVFCGCDLYPDPDATGRPGVVPLRARGRARRERLPPSVCHVRAWRGRLATHTERSGVSGHNRGREVRDGDRSATPAYTGQAIEPQADDGSGVRVLGEAGRPAGRAVSPGCRPGRYRLTIVPGLAARPYDAITRLRRTQARAYEATDPSTNPDRLDGGAAATAVAGSAGAVADDGRTSRVPGDPRARPTPRGSRLGALVQSTSGPLWPAKVPPARSGHSLARLLLARRNAGRARSETRARGDNGGGRMRSRLWLPRGLDPVGGAAASDRGPARPTDVEPRPRPADHEPSDRSMAVFERGLAFVLLGVVLLLAFVHH